MNAYYIGKARFTLKELEKEVDKPGGFNEYAQFCEELLFDIVPYLNRKGLEHVINQAESNMCLREEGEIDDTTK